MPSRTVALEEVWNRLREAVGGIVGGLPPFSPPPDDFVRIALRAFLARRVQLRHGADEGSILADVEALDHPYATVVEGEFREWLIGEHERHAVDVRRQDAILAELRSAVGWPEVVGAGVVLAETLRDAWIAVPGGSRLPEDG